MVFGFGLTFFADGSSEWVLYHYRLLFLFLTFGNLFRHSVGIWDGGSGIPCLVFLEWMGGVFGVGVGDGRCGSPVSESFLGHLCSFVETKDGKNDQKSIGVLLIVDFMCSCKC